ncbi:NAD(P)-binding protein [Crassaminicella indica]|uniref:Molybdopterin-dependent oxidoreductase n=1 Tax=Crassaminicella indica TaxID=2855394 RepID=A0ABX8RBX4_9CLOT|nr:NAD(P)-binding protein [Crassaminicella indica]QXM06553.1 molybdopterin-dependent oxidoreductase [Crassaminicella indica]
MAKVRLNINGKEIIAHSGQTILEVAKENGIEIPTLCYDERVEIYGSCGLCVVEVEGIPKLLRACATKISEGMVVKTNTKRVRGSRKMALELLLSDHVGDCRPPCVLACPANTDCQGYVGLIANGQYKEAIELIKEQIPLPASIGRVCPHPCEDACRRQLVEEPISIAALKSFAADIDLNNAESFMPELKPATGKSIAVIGGGPGGLTCAYYLAKEGHSVTIYEAMPKLGGMLRYGIPQYRLPKEILDQEIALIEKMGVKMLPNTKIGKDIQFEYIKNCYDAVFVSIGAWNSTKLNCPGEDLDGVYGGIHFLRKVATNQPIKIGDRVAIVGGGNTAMDACRTAVRLGAKKVYNIYRRTKLEMPAEEIEIREAEEEGVIFKNLTNPIEIIGESGKVTKIRLQKMKQGEPDASGRRRPIPIEGAEEILEVDAVIVAIGQGTDITGFEGLHLTKKGTIIADEHTYQTNLPGVFAGGDATNKGASIAISAIGEAKKAATVICSYLEGEINPYKKPFYVERDDLTEEDFKNREKYSRAKMNHLSAEERKTNFKEIAKGFTEEQAKKEAMRCLECGCHDFFECKLIQLANEYDVKPKRLSGEVHHRQNDLSNDHPFIHRNPDKCILCGLCVRICDEVMGNTALGLIHRGFDTIIQPALNQPLQNTSCISCGQCISVCPTGALGEKLSIEKSVPVKTKETHTICSHCSVGCHLNLNSKGDMLVKAIPNKESSVDNGLLCIKGRFGFDIAQKGTRITKPLIRKNGKLVEVSWDEGILYTAKRAQSLSALYGNNSLAVSISDRYTNEEIYLANKFAKEILGTENICSFNRLSGGIEDVLGYDASTNTFEELLSAETILLIGSDIINDHTIAGIKIRKAVKRGAKLITINPYKTTADEWAYKTITPKNDLSFLKEMTKALIEYGFNPNNAEGFEELKNSLNDVVISPAAKEVAEIYGKSKRAMLVFSQNDITVDAARCIANIAVISNHIGRAYNGIIQLKPNNNSQGLVDMGIDVDAKEIIDGIQDKAIKGLLIFGEDVKGINFSNLEFLMVQDTHLTETCEHADVVLPAVSFAESNGTFTNTERRIQKLHQAIPAICKYQNYQIIEKLANVLGANIYYKNTDEIFNEISQNILEYFKANKQTDKEIFWPVGKERILYTNGFNFPEGKAQLQTIGDGLFFHKKVNTNSLTNSFLKILKKEGLI